jgi:selenide,water dikinase
VALAAGATGATDVTGFGLLGHLGRVAQQSEVDVEVDVAAVPVLTGVRELAAAGVVPGGTQRNQRWVTDRVDREGIDDVDVLVLADAQTSGGLVFGVDPADADAAVAELAATGHTAAVIGRATAPGSGRMRLRA